MEPPTVHCEPAHETDEGPAEKAGTFPCPACRSQQTGVVRGNHPKQIPDANGRPHVARQRRCKDCGAGWETVESVVVGSVRTVDGRRLM